MRGIVLRFNALILWRGQSKIVLCNLMGPIPQEQQNTLEAIRSETWLSSCCG
jgi:hypothetical protein